MKQFAILMLAGAVVFGALVLSPFLWFWGKK